MRLIKKKKVNQFIRRWLPQGLRDSLNRLLGYAIYFHGVYPDWACAQKSAAGYDESALLDKLTAAARAVQTGRAAWEQDGVTWDHIPVDMPIFAALCRVALAEGGRLSVLDFGGGFGSSYFQCRDFLIDTSDFRWSIVEQPMMAAIGKREFERDDLHFYNDLNEAIAQHQPNVALLSGVLQYLEFPEKVLEQIRLSGIRFIIFDRNPCSMTQELITTQVIPASLYAASYPLWLFDCPMMKRNLAQYYELLAEWDGKDPPIRGKGIGATFSGYLFKKRETAV